MLLRSKTFGIVPGPQLGKSVRNGALVGRRFVRLPAVAVESSTASGGASSSGGGGSARGIPCQGPGVLREILHPRRPFPIRTSRVPWCGHGTGPASSAATSATATPASSSGERPFFPPMGVPSDPLLSAAITAADSWAELRDLYGANVRRIDPAQLLELTQRLAHLTGAVVWPEGAPLPEPAPSGGAPWAPVLTEQEAGEVVALAQTLCRATQVCLPEVYGMQQVAGLLQALVSLGVAPPPAWLRSAELVALRTQREGQEQGGRAASSELLNELLAMAAAFQRVGHTPDRAFVALLGQVRPLEEVGVKRAAAVQAAAQDEDDGGDAPVLLVLAAPQLVCLARAVLLWGLQPPAEWPEAYLQATFTRIYRANKLAAAGGGAGLGVDAEVEAAEAEAALGVGGLGSLLWAAVLLEARPADPGGRWMAELSAAALRRLQEVLAAPTVVVAADAAGGGGGSGGSGRAIAAVADGTVRAVPPEAAGASLQDMASLLSAMQQVMYDPGPAWINTCLQAAAAVQARTDPSVALSAAATAFDGSGSPPPGDAMAAVLFLAAQYDHPQDDVTRGSVVGMAQAAQAWMRAQADVAAVAAAAAAAAASGEGQSAVRSAAASPSPPPPLFTSRGLTQVLMALVRMGGQPSEEWVAAWAAAAEALARGSPGFNLDQVVAMLASAAEAEVVLPERLQRALVEGLLTAGQQQQQQAPAAGSGGAAVAEDGGSASGAGAGTGTGIRSLPQFRQLLGVLELQLYPLEPDWLEAFVGLVEDFRLRLGSRELLSVLRVLGGFSDILLADTAGADTQPARAPSTSASSASSASSAGPRAAASTAARRPGAPIVIRPSPALVAAAAGKASSSSSAAAGVSGASSASSAASAPPPPPPAVLDSGWVAGLLDDLKVRGGLRGPDELMQLSQALSTLSAPPSLMSYVEVFAVALTGEDGRSRRPSTAAAAAGPADAAAAPSGPAPAAASKPSAARIRLRLQKEAAAKQGAPASGAAAGASPQPQDEGGAAAATAAEAAEAAAEAQQWSLAWPAMLGAFAAAGHVPQRRWWDRFAAATLPALESYEGPRLASTAMAALGLSSQAAEAEGSGPDGGEEEGEEDADSLAAKLLPSLEWHQQALTLVAEAIRSCPISMDQVRQQAVQVLLELQGQEQGQGQDGAGSGGGDNSSSVAAPPPEFSAEAFAEAVNALSSQLPLLLEPLAQPRLALPPQLLAVLTDVAEEAAEGAEEAVEAAAALVAGAGPRAGNGRAAGRAAGGGGGGGGGEEVGKDGEEDELDLDSIAYAQQIITLVMQALIASDQAPSSSWMSRVTQVMTAGRLAWGPGSETGELQQQQQLLLNADQLTSLCYLAGRFEMDMRREQVQLVLQHAARLVSSGELAAGELAATLAGLSGVQGVEVVEEGPAEVETMIEALASQSPRLSPQGLSEAASALLQLGLGLTPDTAVRFRTATARSLPELTPPQMLAVLAAGGSLGLDPPSRELLAALSMQVDRLAAHPDTLAPAAATEAAYEVLKWFPEVAPNDSEAYVARLRAGLQPLLGRLDEVVAPSAAKLALLLASAGVVPEPPAAASSSGGSGGGAGLAERQRRQRAAALEPLVAATREGLSEYDNEQLSNAVMGLSLLGLQLPSAWLEAFLEASRRQLADADGRCLSYILSGLADQRAPPDGPYAVDFWAAVRRRAGPPHRDLDLLSARTLLEAAGQLGMRPDRDTMQAVLDCALLPYKDRPDPAGLTELVQVMAAFSFVPSPSWAADVRTALVPALSALAPDARDAVLAFLRAAMPTNPR